MYRESTRHYLAAKVGSEQMISQAEMAELIGITQPSVSRLMRGAPIGRRTAVKIAKVLNYAVPWHEIMIMAPDELRRRLEEVSQDGENCGN